MQPEMDRRKPGIIPGFFIAFVATKSSFVKLSTQRLFRAQFRHRRLQATGFK